MAVRLARRIRTFFRDTSGTNTVEFVAMTPVLLVALVFSFEFGRALWAYDVMSRDVRAATRFLSRDANADLTLAQNLAETGSPAGGAKHFPWNTATATFTTTNPAKTGTYGTAATVFRISAELPITLSFLEAMNSFLFRTGANIDTGYTLVVTDEVRWIGE